VKPREKTLLPGLLEPPKKMQRLLQPKMRLPQMILKKRLRKRLTKSLKKRLRKKRLGKKRLTKRSKKNLRKKQTMKSMQTMTQMTIWTNLRQM
jgi:siroheme synthase (precorrin-2 oxidase/ferrochelatase)